MADIFISYASEDGPMAKVLAEALEAHGWSVWWDRKIPLGKSFDEVIERALGEAKGVIVLWSAVSVTSEWVRNEASEAKKRGILIPVFLEDVNAPLAFRLLNGANLKDWKPAEPHVEFDKLLECIQLLQQPRGAVASKAAQDDRYSSSQRPRTHTARLRQLRFAVGGISILLVLLMAMVYYLKVRRTETAERRPNDSKSDNSNPSPEIPALPPGITTAFYSKDLGIRIAFVSKDQSVSAMELLPVGAVVMEVESGLPAGKGGLQAGDVITTINGKKINTTDDLRQVLRQLGPGKTTFSVRRGDDTKTLIVNCPNCKDTS
jgi:TIR domain/PDZ domain